ncbi:4-diphosphocytidyl-2-C-methyl-D-erythritol kinase [Candidatus Entotheonellaceae bacterium PAL068K]
MTRLIRQAPAKVNVGLAVHRRRRDGYHDISTIFLKISLTDVLSFKAMPRDIVVHCDHPGVANDAGNLVYRAATALQPLTASGGVRIHLHKAIPVAAGLGGGSSDAAATLLGLNTLWDLRLSRAELLRYAAPLGADVPFFLSPTVAALGRGRGDDLEPVACPRDLFLVLVNPRFAVSTAWVYAQYSFELTAQMNKTTILKQYLESGDLASLGGALFNDLEAVVLPHFSGVREVKQALARPGVWGVCMSGSGPTVYALCASQEVACEVAGALRHCAWDVWVCQPWGATSDWT